jgi:hypothetical protein
LPDLNPIEEFLAELKYFIRKQWHKFESSPHQDFGFLPEWCVNVVGEIEGSVKVHFRHAGVTAKIK